MRILALTALLAASSALAADVGDDFTPLPARSIALGPVRRDGVLVSADFGWLRSGIRGDLGLSDTLNFVFRFDTFAFDYGFAAQNAVYGGLRWSPLGPTSTAAFSVTAEVGSVLHGGSVELVMRGELAVGAILESLANPYVRVAVRGLSFDAGNGGSFAQDGELAAGLERRMGPVLVGAEGSVWLRPSLDAIPQWRLRVAHQF